LVACVLFAVAVVQLSSVEVNGSLLGVAALVGGVANLLVRDWWKARPAPRPPVDPAVTETGKRLARATVAFQDASKQMALAFTDAARWQRLIAKARRDLYFTPGSEPQLDWVYVPDKTDPVFRTAMIEGLGAKWNGRRSWLVERVRAGEVYWLYAECLRRKEDKSCGC
jgi:hypothetical protein